MSDVILILDADGTVVGASLGQPPEGSLIPGLTAIPRQGEQWVGWTRQPDGSFLPPGGASEYFDLSAYAAARRFEIETAGIQIGGMAIRTDRESQGLIDRAYALSLVDPAAPITFKAVTGPVTIDAATMQFVAIAVGRHVRDAFVREGQALLAIESGAVTDTSGGDAILKPAP